MNPLRDPLQVLYLNPFAELGGAEHSLLALLETLPSAVCPRLVTSEEGVLARRARELSVPVTLLPFPGLRPGSGFRSALRTLTRLMGDERIGLVHGNSPRGAFYGGLAARRAGVPSLWHLRVHLGRGARVRLLRRFNDHAVAISRSLLDEAGIPKSDPRARVVPNGVPESLILPEPPAPRGGRDVVIGTVGRIEPLKGQREFVEMALRFHQRRLPGTFLIAGEVLGPPCGRPRRRAERYHGSLRRRVEQAGAGERIRFVGPVDDVGAFLDSLDILVVPSHMEGFGRVVIEGMARGLPVVATSVGGIPEIIETGVDGWLVPRRDPEALFRACSFLARNPVLAAEMGARGWRHARVDYISSRTTRAILDFYREITGHPLECDPPRDVDKGEERERCVSLST